MSGDGLFSAVGLEDPEVRAGYRLQYLEILNWGTFDGRVWSLRLDGSNTLLTGDIGSGKSTLVDAITTLLLPANKIAYNKAAGAETRERDLRSYVQGHHKSESNEATGTSRAVALRPGSTYSVILGVFGNEGFDRQITLAQVFWMKDGHHGQPDRFFCVAERAMSITADFADFGPDPATLKGRLRKGGAQVRDHFPEYGKDFRRALGIESEQAMDLFHQTVSMKAVANLNEFVRSHMLEPFDSATWVDKLVSHFGDLTRSHEAVLKARAQLGDLQPLLVDCDAHDQAAAQIARLVDQRVALRYYLAARKIELLKVQISRYQADLSPQHRSLEQIQADIEALREKKDRLNLERAGHGGDRLGEIERQVAAEQNLLNDRQRIERRFAAQLDQVGLRPVDSAEQFVSRRVEIVAESTRATTDLADCQNEATEITVEQAGLKAESDELRAELASLQQRRSSIPREYLRIRSQLCQELSIPEGELPFAGELIAVRQEYSEWEGAAERVLRGFGVSMLVDDRHYATATTWINDHHLGTRLVYYRVLPVSGSLPRHETDPGVMPLHATLEIKQPSPFYGWLERELVKRADYACVDSMQEFRKARSAVTRQGLVRRENRNEKDDRRKISDRSNYVLGWDNQQKIDALLDQMTGVQNSLNSVAARHAAVEARRATATFRKETLTRLDEYQEYGQIDWRSVVNRIAALNHESEELQRASHELERLGRELTEVKRDIVRREQDRQETTLRIGGLDHSIAEAVSSLQVTAAILAGPGSERAEPSFAALEKLVRAEQLGTPADCDRAESEAQDTLTGQIDARTRSQATVSTRIVTRMAGFRGKYPLDTLEFDNSMGSIDEYRQLHHRLSTDDLPRFEYAFKTYLNTNTIRDIATFHSKLNQQLEQIKDRVGTINSSLYDIDYNPGRYIRLDTQTSPVTDIRDFRADLRACTDDSLSGDDSDQYSEQKFVQVKMIIERLSGREGYTEIDRTWTRKVTDVRNWFVFSASERWRDGDTEHENYTDSGGKSGGQKEKLAYTILAASLAYQFKLEWGATRSKDFRFVVIDEAFGRGSETSTRFALELFRRLGLQLLIVTPLQKIHVIEPYVSSVGFVDNLQGDASRLQNLTIQEYRERQLEHATRVGRPEVE